jgi:NTE family protein
MSGRLVEGFETVLVLGGGNALGAYHLGVCEALLARDEPARILGCSIGAAMGAILLGNAPEQRIERMREFWAAVALRDEPWTRFMPEQVRARWSNGVGLSAILQGRRGVSAPRFPGWLSLLPLMPPDVSVQDHKPMGQLLDRLVDWGRVNDSPIGFAFPAIDIERGEVVWWDNRTTRIEARHILATTAFPPLLPPVEIDGRKFWDGGLGENLPVRRAFEDAKGPVVCVASDLYAPFGDAPGSIDGSLTRAQDLGFALQARLHVEGLVRERALLKRAEPGTPPGILLHLIHHPPTHQRALKSLDFSGTAIDERAAQGRRDAEAGLGRLESAPLTEALATVRLPVG